MKLLLPDGFIQTGGNYVDYAGTELSAANPTVAYTIKGYFTKAGAKNDFRLLRSHANADANSLFVEKAQLSLLYAVDTQKQNRSGRLASCDFSDSQFLFNWYGEQIYAHIYNGVLFAAYQNASQGFKPQSWLQATGYDTGKLSCFATTDPHTTTTTPPTTTNPPTPNNPPTGSCSVSSPTGSLDFADCNGVGGWAFDRSNLNQPVTIDIYVDGNKTYSGVTANGDRQDLVSAFGNAAARYHGFNYSFPANASWKNGQNHTISVRICGSNNDVGGSPKTVNGCSGGTPNPTTPTTPSTPTTSSCSVSSPRGGVDVINGNGVSGWALDASDLSKTVMIDIYINGTKVASTPANEDRADLVNAFNNNALARYHGFSIALTNLGSVAKNYSISIQICGTANPLGSGQVTVNGRSSGSGSEEPTDCGTLPEIIVKAKATKWGYPVCRQGQGSGSTGTGTGGPDTGGNNGDPSTNDPGGTTGNNNPGSGSGTPSGTDNPTVTGARIPTTANMDGIDCEKITGWAFANGGGYAYLDIYVANIYGQLNQAATIKANNASRPDVRAAYGNNSNIPLDCGFVWAIPDVYKNGHSLTIKVVPVNDVSDIGQSPKTTSGDCNKPVTTTPPQFPVSWKNFPDLTIRGLLWSFFTDMSAKGISFTDEEQALIAEYPDLMNSIRTYVNQYGTKPDGSHTFILSAEDQQKYPRFTEIVNGMPAFVEQHDRVKQALIQHTNLPWNKIKVLLKPGLGPKVVVNELNNLYGHTVYPAHPEPFIEINAKYVRGLESANLSGTREATAFLLAVTLLHELTHYGAVDGGRGENRNNEFGDDFEREVLGTTISKSNAGQLLVDFIKRN